MIHVTLTQYEFRFAQQVGKDRAASARQMNLREYNNAERDRNEEYHARGAIGELVAAKGLGLYWPPAVGDTSKGDIGNGVEVRARKYEGQELYLKRTDNDDSPFVLVTPAPGFNLVDPMDGYDPEKKELIGPEADASWFNALVVGWIRAGDGKNEDWFDDRYTPRRPAFWVPDQALQPIDEEDLRRWHRMPEEARIF